MDHAERELLEKRQILHRRVVDVYKRGPMFTIEALLSAHSFGELVARYKYLHLLALRDRALVGRVEQLRDQKKREHDRLVTLQAALEDNRTDKQREEAQLRALERERGASLANTKQQAKQAESRIAQLKATESALANAIASFEADRRRAEIARPSRRRDSSSS